MARLRKMLGDAKHPIVLELMHLIETQSKDTLCRWALDYVQTQYLPILMDRNCCDTRFSEALEAVQDYLEGKRSLKELKASTKSAALAVKEIPPENADALAAAKAIHVACCVAQTPTSALGFTFYGAAAYAYHRAGLKESPSVYDVLATEEFERLLYSLRSISIQNEPNPIQVDWIC